MAHETPGMEALHAKLGPLSSRYRGTVKLSLTYASLKQFNPRMSVPISPPTIALVRALRDQATTT